MPEKSGNPRIPLRKCRRKQVKNDPNPSYLVSHPSGHEVSSHRANYFNKPGGENRMTGGIKFSLRKNDSDTEVADSWYPTFNDMMRMDESDTDPDMPAMVDQKDLSPDRKKCGVEGDVVSLCEIRELIATDLSLIDDGACVINNEELQDNEPGKTPDARLGGLQSEHDERAEGTHRHRTGGGGGATLTPDAWPLEADAMEIPSVKTALGNVEPAVSMQDESVAEEGGKEATAAVPSEYPVLVSEDASASAEEQEDTDGGKSRAASRPSNSPPSGGASGAPEEEAAEEERSKADSREKEDESEETPATEAKKAGLASADSEEEGGATKTRETQLDEEGEVAEAAPYPGGIIDKDEDESIPKGPLVMRWRSPGNSDESESGTEEVDLSPHSISLSVSEVQTSVFEEMKMGNLTRPDWGVASKKARHERRTPCSMILGEPAGSTKPANNPGSGTEHLPVPPVMFPKPVGKSLARRGKLSIPPQPALKMFIKKEVKKEEIKIDRAKTEEVDTVFTRARADTPTHTRGKDPVTNPGGAVITYRRPTSSGETEDEQDADYGDSDGEDMRRLARPKRTSVIYMRRTRPVLPTGKSSEGEKCRRAPPKRKRREEENIPRQRTKKRTEIQKSIDKRKDATNKRQMGIEGMHRRKQFFQVETRELGVEELQAESRATEQERTATRMGRIPIIRPIKYPTGPLPWGSGKIVATQEEASSSGGPTLGGLPPGLCLPSPPDEVEGKTAKNRRHREKEPEPRISEDGYKNVGRVLDIWAWLGGPARKPGYRGRHFLRGKSNVVRKTRTPFLFRGP